MGLPTRDGGKFRPQSFATGWETLRNPPRACPIHAFRAHCFIGTGTRTSGKIVVVKRLSGCLPALATTLLFALTTPAAPRHWPQSTGSPGACTPENRPGSPRSPGNVVPVASIPARQRLYAQSLSTADTVLVFNDDLESLSSPGNEGGWTRVDESAQPTGWNISNLYACGSNASGAGSSTHRGPAT
jgi:hypothetical protein